MDRLFEPFFRASNARKLVASGTGLGLAFVRAVARAGGGEVVARRSELGGTEIVLECRRPRTRSGEQGGEQEPSFRVVVIGGVAAGPKVASKVMRLRPDAHVTIVEMGRVLSYAGCGLPYYISGMVREQQELISTPEGQVRGPEYFESIKNVHVMNRTEAVRIDREGRRVLVRDLIGGQERWLPYDKLAIATGALPIVPDVPGARPAQRLHPPRPGARRGHQGRPGGRRRQGRDHRRRRPDRRGDDRVARQRRLPRDAGRDAAATAAHAAGLGDGGAGAPALREQGRARDPEHARDRLRGRRPRRARADRGG